MISSAYIHIPFCRRKCHYCSFISYPKIETKEQYIKALVFEIKNRYKGDTLKTLYIGGGTPSLLLEQDIETLISLFNFEKECEITCETNPENVSFQWLKNIKSIGVNRLSIGVQSFDDHILESIGRKHTTKDTYNVINNAKNAGFENISIDLIYGLPEQTKENFFKSVEIASKIGIQHISSYGLKIESGSFFYKNKPKNLPDDDIQADMYLKLCDITEKYDFHHYEISNFAKKNYYSQHNLNYWNAENYYGFGCAASGYEYNLRYSHTQNLEKYISNPICLNKKEKITPKMSLEEHIFLGFRKTSGLNIKFLNNKFNVDFEKKYSSILKKYSQFFIKTDAGYALTNQGLLLSNIILSDFIS